MDIKEKIVRKELFQAGFSMDCFVLCAIVIIRPSNSYSPSKINESFPILWQLLL